MMFHAAPTVRTAAPTVTGLTTATRYFRLRRILAMYRLAAALPFTSRAFFARRARVRTGVRAARLVFAFARRLRVTLARLVLPPAR